MTKHHLRIPPTLAKSADRVVRKLAHAERTIVCAESCTAGLIAAALSEGEGASDVLHGCFVTYTKDQKTRALGVPKGLLARTGSVTAEVAKRMATGALTHSPAHMAIAVTGVLGPLPDEDGNPVGLVYFGWAVRGKKPRTVRKQFRKGPHDELRYRTVMTALQIVNSAI